MTQRSTQCGGGRPDDSTTCASGVNTMSAARTVETVMKTHLDHDVPARHVAAAHAPLWMMAHAQERRVPRRPKVLGGALSTAAATKAEKSRVVVKATWAQAGRGEGRRTCMRSRNLRKEEMCQRPRLPCSRPRARSNEGSGHVSSGPQNHTRCGALHVQRRELGCQLTGDGWLEERRRRWRGGRSVPDSICRATQHGPADARRQRGQRASRAR